MRLFTTALVVLAMPVTITPAIAADIATQTKIHAVTVYRSGARIERMLRQKIDAGIHTLVINDLPAQAILGSIRVEGQADGDLLIGAVDTKRISVLSSDAKAQNKARADLEAQLNQLTDAMDQLRAEIETKETQKAFISNLAGLPKQPPAAPSSGGTVNQDWAKLLELIGNSMADVQGSLLETRIAMRELDRRIADVNKKLSELATKQTERTEVRISVEAGAKLNANLVIKYQVRSASWRPHYDARLTTGTADIPASLLLTRRASVQQHTGEVWPDVQLALSTSRPSGKSAAPNLRTWTVDFRRPAPPRPVARLSQAPRHAKMEADQEVSENRGISRRAFARGKPKAVRQTSGVLKQSAFQASFAVPGNVTIANTGEAKRVKLDDQKIAPKLNIRTAPRRDKSAYLYAGMTLPKTAPYLSGPVSLFRDGGFVGMGRLPNLAPGASHELGFGADPSVVIKYHVLGEKRGESGLISSSSTDQRNFKINVSNQHERSINIVVIDQIPVALNEDITVDLLGSTKPTKRNYKDRRGVLAWSFTLEGAAKRSINFGYRISWPANKKIGFGYR